MTAKDFGIGEKELYRVWLAYIHGLANKVKASDIISEMRKSEDIDGRALDYFAAVGLNAFLESVSERISNKVPVEE